MDVGIWEGLGYLGFLLLGGGGVGVYGQQRAKGRLNGNGNSDNSKTGKYMTVAEHERLCPARFELVHTKLEDMHGDIKDLKK